MIGHLNATLDGLTTIRASQTQELLRKEFDEHQDLYNSVSYMQLATTRAFGLYIDVLCAFYITIITFSFIFVKTGLIITYLKTVHNVLFLIFRCSCWRSRIGYYTIVCLNRYFTMGCTWLGGIRKSNDIS